MKEKAKKTKAILAEVAKKKQKEENIQKKKYWGRLFLFITSIVSALFLFMFLFTGFSISLILFILLWIWFLPFVSNSTKKENFSFLTLISLLFLVTITSTFLFLLTPNSEVEKKYFQKEYIARVEKHQKENPEPDGIYLFLNELAQQSNLIVDKIETIQLNWTTPNSSLSVQRSKRVIFSNPKEIVKEKLYQYFNENNWDHGPVGFNFQDNTNPNRIGWANSDSEGKYQGILCVIEEISNPINQPEAQIVLTCGFGPGGKNNLWQ